MFSLWFLLGFFWFFCWGGFRFWVWLEICFLLILLVMMYGTGRTSIILFVLFEYIFSVFYFFWCFFQVDWLLWVFLVGKIGLFPFWVWIVRIFQEFSIRFSFLLVTFYKLFVFVLVFYFSWRVPIFSLLALNFFSGFFLLKSIFDVFLFLCFSVIFSSGWFLLLGNSEVVLVFFLIYSLFFILVVGLSWSGYRKNFMWLVFWCFYIGYPFFLRFFFKLVGFFYMVEASFVLGMIMSLNRLFFILAVLLVLQEGVFFVGVLFFCLSFICFLF